MITKPWCTHLVTLNPVHVALPLLPTARGRHIPSRGFNSITSQGLKRAISSRVEWNSDQTKAESCVLTEHLPSSRSAGSQRVLAPGTVTKAAVLRRATTRVFAVKGVACLKMAA